METRSTEVQLLLDSFENAKFMIDKEEGEKRNSLVSMVMQLYEANEKTTQFLDWAVNQEVQSTKEVVSLCRSDSFLTHVMSVILFSPLGVKYLVRTTLPFLNEILMRTKVEETTATPADTSFGKYVSFPASDQDLEWAMQAIDDLITLLRSSVDLCPVAVREIFGTINKAAAAHYGEKYHIQVVTSLIFLRFICPPLLRPHQFGFTDQDTPLLPESQKALVWCIKLLQSISNNSKFEPTKEHPQKLTDFIARKHLDASDFTQKLVDEKEIAKCQRMIEASVCRKSFYGQMDKSESEKALEKFWDENNIGPLFQLKAQMEGFSKLIESDCVWKFEFNTKDKRVAMYSRKVRTSSVFCWKVVSVCEGSLDIAKKVLQQNHQEIVGDGDKSEVLEGEEGSMDFHIKLSMPFPLKDREILLRRHWFPSADTREAYVVFSVERDDRPEKRVRALVSDSGFEIKQEGVNLRLTQIMNVDFKGKMPSFLVNTMWKQIAANMIKVSHDVERKSFSETKQVG